MTNKKGKKREKKTLCVYKYIFNTGYESSTNAHIRHRNDKTNEMKEREKKTI